MYVLSRHIPESHLDKKYEWALFYLDLKGCIQFTVTFSAPFNHKVSPVC